MSPEERFRLVEGLCQQALDLPVEERGRFLREACADEELRREVESLLAMQSVADRMMSQAGELLSGSEEEDTGTTGQYVIEAKLGEGGMGVVYRARQTTPVLREVALKVIRPGMASRQLVARFEIERQALAIMDHPNIARVLDAGATSRGLPFLVMELVEGRNIATYCQEAGLSVRGKVELMIAVCQAIQHAHTKGIIHRDIKPANVLVATYDGKPVPKVIDFGIAKAIESAQAVPPGATRPGAMVGTFEYVSPEQVEPKGTDIDTRTDVYSLGVLLYELLAGRPPVAGLTPERMSYAEIVRRIREEAPEPLRLKGAERELEWIVGRALEKERERRYQTAEALAMDLRRYLEGEPVEAAPPSTGYRVRKFAGRYRWGIGVAAAVVVLLVVAVGWMAFALQQQKRANAHALALREVVRKFVTDRPQQLLRIPNRTAIETQLLKDAEGALEALSMDTSDDPELQLDLAKAYLAIGRSKGGVNTTGSAGEFAKGLEYMKRALDLFSKLAERDPKRVVYQMGKLSSLVSVIGVERVQGDAQKADALAQQGLREISKIPAEIEFTAKVPTYRAICYREMAEIRSKWGQFAAAYEMQQKALEAYRPMVKDPKFGDGERDYLATLEAGVAIAGWNLNGVTEETVKQLEESVRIAAPCTLPSCRLRGAELKGRLGDALFAMGRREEAIRSLKEGVAGIEAVLADDPSNVVLAPRVDYVMASLALVLADGGKDFKEGLAVARKLVAPERKRAFPMALAHKMTLGAVLVEGKQYAEAIAQLDQAVAFAAGKGDWNMMWSLEYSRTRALVGMGKFEEAVEAARRAMAVVEQRTKGAAHAVTLELAQFAFAEAVARWSGATPELRAEARGMIEKCCKDAPAEMRRLQTGVLLVGPPVKAEVERVRGMLR